MGICQHNTLDSLLSWLILIICSKTGNVEREEGKKTVPGLRTKLWIAALRTNPHLNELPTQSKTAGTLSVMYELLRVAVDENRRGKQRMSRQQCGAIWSEPPAAEDLWEDLGRGGGRQQQSGLGIHHQSHIKSQGKWTLAVEEVCAARWWRSVCYY